MKMKRYCVNDTETEANHEKKMRKFTNLAFSKGGILLLVKNNKSPQINKYMYM